MLSKEITMEILTSFMQECYNFWRRQNKEHKEAFQFALRDIECINHDPYDPWGDKLDPEAKTEFLRKERSM